MILAIPLKNLQESEFLSINIYR